MFRILLAEPLDDPTEARLSACAQVVRAPRGDEDTLCDLIAGCDALITRTSTRVTRRLLAAGDRLRVVGVAGVGLDNVDQPAAAERGVAVLHTPAASSDAVAELTLLFILELLRPTRRMTAAYQAGEFRAARAAPHGVELRTLTVGIVGMGRIGSRVGRLCAAFGGSVLYNDVAPVGPFDFPAAPVRKEELWRSADVVTLHTPLTPQTHRLVSAAVLACMKPGALLVNAARGALVDTDALCAALRGGALAGAALDVTDPEPLPPEHELLHLPSAVVTPHIAARTIGGLQRMLAVADDVIAWLRSAPPR